jgi:hypothetical protein
MLRFLFSLIGLWSWTALAVPCDCEVKVYSPLTGSHRLTSNVIKTYPLESFSSYSVKNQLACRSLCLSEFQNDMPSARLNALLLTYSERLIEEGVLGHNCTGLTTLKYPIRVKARLGSLSLGNVVDQIQVINHEVQCF